MNFKNVKVTNLEGESVNFDVAKGVGNYIYQRTGDLGMLDAAREIYKTGKAELTDEQRTEIIGLIKDRSCPFIAIVKEQIINSLEANSK